MEGNWLSIALHLLFVFGYGVGYFHAQVGVPWQLFLLVYVLVGALLSISSLLRKKD